MIKHIMSRAFWPFMLVLMVLASLFLQSCAKEALPVPDTPLEPPTALMEVTELPWLDASADQKGSRVLPYVLDQIGNTDVWTASQGLGAAVSDNYLTTIPQTQQSPSRKMKDYYGTAYHRAKALAYVVDANGVPLGYRIQGGGFSLPNGDSVPPCTFFAGLDSYMRGLYLDPLTDESITARAWVLTSDTIPVRIPVFNLNEWIAIPVFDGRWWNGEHPDFDWPISGI